MARIRSIKPETPEDEVLAKVCREARLLFILLWTQADDLGRFRANPTFLKNKLFPYDEDLSSKQVDDWLSQLALIKRIEIYKVAGQAYGVIVNWAKHQRIDNASKSTLPDPSEADSPQPAETRGEIPRDSARLGDSPLLLRKGKERIGVEASPRKSAAHTIPKDFSLSEEMALYASEKGMLNVPFEFERFVNHHTAKGSMFKDWIAAWRTWVGNGIQFQSRASTQRTNGDFQPPKKLNPELYQDQ